MEEAKKRSKPNEAKTDANEGSKTRTRKQKTGSKTKKP